MTRKYTPVDDEQEDTIPCAGFSEHALVADIAKLTTLLPSLERHFPEIDPQTFRIARGLKVCHALMMALTDTRLRPYGLSWSKLFVLLSLRAAQEAGSDGLAPSALSTSLKLTRNTMSTLLSGLERQGYIERDDNPEDRRRFVIRLTPAGQAIIQTSGAPLFVQLQELLQQLKPAQHDTLLDGLTQLQRALTHQITAHNDTEVGDL